MNYIPHIISIIKETADPDGILGCCYHASFIYATQTQSGCEQEG